MSADRPGLAARRAALQLLEGVQQRGLLLDEMTRPLAPLEPGDRARAITLARGVLRDIGRLDAVLAQFMARKPEPEPLDILRLATWEMLRDGIAAHAAVDSAVALAQENARARRAAGLINAVSRKVAALEETNWDELPHMDLPAPLAGPIGRAYGKANLAVMMDVQAQVPPLDITLKNPNDAAEWAEKLGAVVLPTGSLRMDARVQVSTLPGYAEGAWWVQDTAAAQPVRLAGDVDGLRALDMCAAPGGKTMQLAAAGADVTAIDNAEYRLERLRENLARTQLSAKIIAADALQWSPQSPFDLIVLDAPCTATGTIRRHPDLPFVKDLDDIRPLLKLQADLLYRALGWLTSNGRLIYCTCSLLPAEGETQIAKLLARRATVRQIIPDCPSGLQPEWLDDKGNLRLRPDYWADRGGMDGFFAAMLGLQAKPGL